MDNLKTNSLGKHYIVEFYDCELEKLNHRDLLEQTMVNAAIACGATVISQHFHLFTPYGISGVVILAESHLTIHTWPEHCYAAIDLFTCSSKIEPKIALDHMTSYLLPQKINVKSIHRGVFNSRLLV